MYGRVDCLVCNVAEKDTPHGALLTGDSLNGNVNQGNLVTNVTSVTEVIKVSKAEGDFRCDDSAQSSSCPETYAHDRI